MKHARRATILGEAGAQVAGPEAEAVAAEAKGISEAVVVVAVDGAATGSAPSHLTEIFSHSEPTIRR
jgi:hypothetical protein